MSVLETKASVAVELRVRLRTKPRRRRRISAVALADCFACRNGLVAGVGGSNRL